MIECPGPYGVRAINGLVQVVHGVLRFARVSLHDPRDRLVVRPDDHEVLQGELGDVRVLGTVRRDRAAERARFEILAKGGQFRRPLVGAIHPEPGPESQAMS